MKDRQLCRRFLVASLALLVSSAGAQDAKVFHFTIDATQDVRAISPYIYGVNAPLAGAFDHCTFTRVGGNRLTAYNWVNNASNAGSDWQFQNDDIMGGGDVPGGAVLPRIQNAIEHRAALLLTIPTAGYVAADKRAGGDVRHSGPDYLKTRFRVSRPSKDSPFTLTPSADGAVVFQDEFANWVKSEYAHAGVNAPPVFYSLDNEPDLGSATHAEVHPQAVTYAEMVERSTAYAKAIKAVAPKALIFGPVNYGWQGYTTLQNAPDANGRDFQAFYLAAMKSAERSAGKRLLDVFDVHWYPEAQGGGVRITGAQTMPEVVAARVQAPRSLWDKTYTETSWITQWSTRGPIQLIPRLLHKIDENYPGTKLAITEYNYGGGSDISGAIAQADVLGIFGREGVFAANEWPLAKDESFIGAAFELFRNFDGKGGAFASSSIAAKTDDITSTSVYASRDADDAGIMTVVLINKTPHDAKAEIKLERAGAMRSAEIFQLTSAKPGLKPAGTLPIDAAGLAYQMPAYSVSMLRLSSHR